MIRTAALMVLAIPGSQGLEFLPVNLEQATRQQESGDVAACFVVLGEDGQPLLSLPPDERLTYRVHVGLGFLNADVGKVTQTCIVEPYRRSIFMAGEDDDEELASATITMHAKGDYSIYSLDSTIETRHLPQDWPRIIYRSTQSGSSKRRRENLIGIREGHPTSSYRRDRSGDNGERIWRDAVYRSVNGRPLDLLSAVFACRTLVQAKHEEIVVPLLENDRLWKLALRIGPVERIQTGAGEFDGVEILLEPEPWPDEEIEAEDVERFEGLFGLQGAIRLWVCSRTGVPLRIQGDLPVGPITIRIDVILDAYQGTPLELHPVGAASEAAPGELKEKSEERTEPGTGQR